MLWFPAAVSGLNMAVVTPHRPLTVSDDRRGQAPVLVDHMVERTRLVP